ncbi:hypothetical protein TRICI_006246 [Trichomonascus ciferrii]|uniref:Signal peptide peptidase n=1 Tax=Trichomonascus ciferrii TaxID=44093 RepID=A0A642UJ63_9ASCO|nr:hypothetical protein TRICI_006246 [Trichomonascus ciferrii]
MNSTALAEVAIGQAVERLRKHGFEVYGRINASVAEWNVTEHLRALDDLDFVWRRVPFPPILVTYGIVLALAMLIVYFSSVSTLQRPVNAAEPNRKDKKLFHPSDLKACPSEERMSNGEAYMMPFVGAFALLSLYFAFKYFSEERIQQVLRVYFFLASFVAIVSVFSLFLMGTARIVFNTTVPHWRWTSARDPDYHEFGISVAEEDEDRDRLFTPVYKRDQSMNIYYSLGELLGVPISAVICYLNYIRPHWILGNLVGGSLAISGIRTIRLGSFSTGFIMLAGLFLYDIYFVFGTNVMVTVATKVKAPVKLEVPRPMTTPTDRAMAMLGLGDIVVPAMFLSLCLRFDLWNFHRQNTGLPFHLARKFPRPYFIWGLVSYAAGLVVTIYVMHIFQTGQPALLYLCPAIAFTTLIVALVRGELGLLWQYKDAEEEEHKDDKNSIGSKFKLKQEKQVSSPSQQETSKKKKKKGTRKHVN